MLNEYSAHGRFWAFCQCKIIIAWDGRLTSWFAMAFIDNIYLLLFLSASVTIININYGYVWVIGWRIAAGRWREPHPWWIQRGLWPRRIRRVNYELCHGRPVRAPERLRTRKRRRTQGAAQRHPRGLRRRFHKRRHSRGNRIPGTLLRHHLQQRSTRRPQMQVSARRMSFLERGKDIITSFIDLM